MIKNIEKVITIKYKDLDTLLNREEAMIQTMRNYVSRENEYEYVESFITSDSEYYRLNLKIRLRD